MFKSLQLEHGHVWALKCKFLLLDSLIYLLKIKVIIFSPLGAKNGNDIMTTGLLVSNQSEDLQISPPSMPEASVEVVLLCKPH